MSAIAFDIDATDGAARAARIGTPHGIVHTPSLCPVATQATVKSLTPDELREVGSEIVLADAYHLYLRPGPDLIAELGGLHRFMSWDGPTMTESGSGQLFSLGFGRAQATGEIAGLLPGDADDAPPSGGQKPRLKRVDAEGVMFTSHIDGSTHRLTPEISIGVQEKLGADLMLAFDQPTSPLADERHAAEALERTHAWARRCLDARTRSDQGLIGVVQGGTYEKLRRESATCIGSLPFDGFAIGGSLGRSQDDTRHVLEWSIPALPEDKPRHMPGTSEPEDIFDAVERGVDTFDCASAVRLARRGMLLVPTGRIDITKAGYREDFTPVDPACDCYTCTTFARAYLRHLFNAGELLAYRLATIHNLRFMLRLMSDIREAIAQHVLREFRGEFESRWKSV